LLKEITRDFELVKQKRDFAVGAIV